MEQLKYSDENDRSLGIAGTAISMVVWDAERYIAAVSLDNGPGDGIEMTPDFHFAGNPRFSARLVWQQMIKQLELSSAMLIGNVMCRSYVGNGRRPSSAATAAIRALVRDEARTVCSLDDDETERIYERTYQYVERLFTHPSVASIANNFADTLRTRRRLSAAEVLDQLSALNRL